MSRRPSVGYVGHGNAECRGQYAPDVAVSVVGTDAVDRLAEPECIFVAHLALFQVFECLGKEFVDLLGELVVQECVLGQRAELDEALGHQSAHGLVAGIKPGEFPEGGAYLAHPRRGAAPLDTMYLLVDGALVLVKLFVYVRDGKEVEQLLGLAAAAVYVHDKLAQLRCVKFGYGLAEDELGHDGLWE